MVVWRALQACHIDSRVDVLEAQRGARNSGWSLAKSQVNVDTSVDAARLEARATSESAHIETTGNVHFE
jgi:hypothetical protein